ncbi:type II secretion system minor pseudopilin GspH [Arhodomonas sp. SL1]|uniref:type II secretion system minor pseudopilin GspH n=1 Tax=Arhodomonas sp. SL1 TaxID=3425691 RepID=UPI003F882E72
MSPDRGFTLLEILVVLVIMGVILSLAVLRLAPTGSEEGQRIAAQLLARLELARDESILRSRPLGVRIEPERYTFLLAADGAWQPLEGDRALGETRMPGNLRLTVSADGRTARAPGDDGDDADKDPAPSLVFYPSGEVTPFTLELRNTGTDRRWSLEGFADGRLSLEAGETAGAR